MRKLISFLALMLLFATAATAQTRQLQGTVKDSKTAAGLAGVTVKVAGKNIQAVTDGNGAFTLSVPAGKIVLEVTSVGYATQLVGVGASANAVSVLLAQTATDLSEVVVTALGITKQARKLGYAVTTVDGAQLNQARETNVANSLSGRVAGLKVSGTSGGPGGTVKLLLRGLPSMNGQAHRFL